MACGPSGVTDAFFAYLSSALAFQKPDPPKLMDEFGYAYREIHGIAYPPFAHEGAIDELRAVDWSREGDVMVATYPKCGTTWIQQIILLLLANGDAAAVTDPMEQAPWVDREHSIATRQSRGDAAKAGRALEGLTGATGEACFGGRRCFKTHGTWGLFPCAKGFSRGKIVVMVRNPKDACASMYKHYLGLPAFKYTGSWAHFFGLFVEGNVGHGCYFNHVLGWRAAAEELGRDRVLWITFEDMKKDVKGGVRQIADFIGVQITDELVEKVARAASFDSMKDAHSERVKTGLQRMGSTQHFRSGKAGGWRSAFTVQQSDELDALFAVRMAGSDVITDFGCGARFRGSELLPSNGA